MGAASHPGILREHNGEIKDPRLSAYVAGVGSRVVLESASAGKHFQFTVLNSPEPDAFTIGGGYVYITRGLLALLGSEAELASILGHEVGHVVARHSAKRRSTQQLMLQGTNPYPGANGGSGLSGARRDYLGTYSRQQEYEADDLGVNYTARAGYDPFALAKGLATTGVFHKTMLRISGHSETEPDTSSTHPSTPERVQRAVRIAAATRIRSGTRPRYEERYLAAIDGLPMGSAKAERVMHLRIHTLEASKSAEEVSRLMHIADHKLDVFLALNGLPKGARLKAGDQVKLLLLEQKPN